MRILFRGKNIYTRDDTLNAEHRITQLVNYLKDFTMIGGVKSVPARYYHSWRILVLGSSEYDNQAYQILREASLNYSAEVCIAQKI
jgi:hypothetical protein